MKLACTNQKELLEREAKTQSRFISQDLENAANILKDAFGFDFDQSVLDLEKVIFALNDHGFFEETYDGFSLNDVFKAVHDVAYYISFSLVPFLKNRYPNEEGTALDIAAFEFRAYREIWAGRLHSYEHGYLIDRGLCYKPIPMFDAFLRDVDSFSCTNDVFNGIFPNTMLYFPIALFFKSHERDLACYIKAGDKDGAQRYFQGLRKAYFSIFTSTWYVPCQVKDFKGFLDNCYKDYYYSGRYSHLIDLVLNDALMPEAERALKRLAVQSR